MWISPTDGMGTGPAPWPLRVNPGVSAAYPVTHATPAPRQSDQRAADRGQRDRSAGGCAPSHLGRHQHGTMRCDRAAHENLSARPQPAWCSGLGGNGWCWCWRDGGHAPRSSCRKRKLKCQHLACGLIRSAWADTRTMATARQARPALPAGFGAPPRSHCQQAQHCAAVCANHRLKSGGNPCILATTPSTRLSAGAAWRPPPRPAWWRPRPRGWRPTGAAGACRPSRPGGAACRCWALC